MRDLLQNDVQAHPQGQEIDAHHDPLSIDHVVAEVFKYTLKEPHPPATLQTLVIDAIVDSEDDELLSTLLGAMNSNMKGKLAMATMRKAKPYSTAAMRGENDRYRGYSDFSRGPSIKSEASDTKRE